MSWRPEVFVEGKWSSNALRFATEEDADTSAFGLMLRWTLCEDSRAVPSTDPVNYRLDEKGSPVALPALEPEVAKTLAGAP